MDKELKLFGTNRTFRSLVISQFDFNIKVLLLDREFYVKKKNEIKMSRKKLVLSDTDKKIAGTFSI